jgi:hypothetical protein
MRENDDDDNDNNAAVKSSVSDILKKALAINSKPTEESFPELPDVLIWARFVIGLFFGFYYGLKDARGGVLPLQVLNLVCFVPVLYCRLYLGLESNVYASNLIFAGTFQAVALFLLIWLYFYTRNHGQEEANLVKLLLNTTVAATNDVLDQATKVIVDEPEF